LTGSRRRNSIGCSNGTRSEACGPPRCLVLDRGPRDLHCFRDRDDNHVQSLIGQRAFRASEPVLRCSRRTGPCAQGGTFIIGMKKPGRMCQPGIVKPEAKGNYGSGREPFWPIRRCCTRLDDGIFPFELVRSCPHDHRRFWGHAGLAWDRSAAPTEGMSDRGGAG
jgi:hypothetical protein